MHWGIKVVLKHPFIIYLWASSPEYGGCILATLPQVLFKIAGTTLNPFFPLSPAKLASSRTANYILYQKHILKTSASFSLSLSLSPSSDCTAPVPTFQTPTFHPLPPASLQGNLERSSGDTCRSAHLAWRCPAPGSRRVLSMLSLWSGQGLATRDRVSVASAACRPPPVLPAAAAPPQPSSGSLRKCR